MTIELDFTFGLPPATEMTKKLVAGTMPTAEIIPAEPQFNKGLNVFKLVNQWDKYEKLLETHGFSLKKKQLKVAFLADNFPTDSFNNDYGESFLDQFVQAASTGVSDVTQFFGQKDVVGLASAAGQAMGDNFAGNMMTKGASQLKGFRDDLKTKSEQKFSGPHGKAAEGMVKSTLKTAEALLLGSRVDFPLVWKNSSFAPSYSMTVRLFNPYPGNNDATEKYIIGPLAALLILGLPRSEDDSTYSWPFFTKVKASGIYNLQSSFINSISVIKGGDQQSIGWNQRLGIVDVRLDFGSLYGSILVEKDPSDNQTRPTLYTYLKAMTDSTISPDPTGDPTNSLSGGTSESVNITNTTTVNSGTSSQQTIADTTVSSRAPTQSKNTADNLVNQGDQNYYGGR